jgi:hypothetical protein
MSSKAQVEPRRSVLLQGADLAAERGAMPPICPTGRILPALAMVTPPTRKEIACPTG